MKKRRIQKKDKTMEYYVNSKFEILTTRFNSHTYNELEEFKKKINYKGSIYNTSIRMSYDVHPEKYLFVLEMNNTTNKIMGIGLIKNRVYKEKRFSDIYDDENFNRNTYRSKFHVKVWDSIKVAPLVDDFEAEYIEEEFEQRVFFGKGHLKRGHSFTRFPNKWLTTRHKMFLVELFQKYSPGINKLLEQFEE